MATIERWRQRLAREVPAERPAVPDEHEHDEQGGTE